MRQSKTLKGNALAAARLIYNTHISVLDRKAELEKRFQAELEQIAKDAQEEVDALWPALLVAAELPLSDLGTWGIDCRYLESEGVAFLFREENEQVEPVTNKFIH
jgi:hypothetical protein